MQTVFDVSCSDLPVTNTAYLIGFWGRRKLNLITIIYIMENLPQWVAEFGKICHAENCGVWS